MSTSNDRDKKSRRTGMAIGFLLAAVIGLGVAIYFVAKDDSKTDTVTQTAPTVTENQTDTVTEPSKTATESSGADTSSSSSSIISIEQQAQETASAAAKKYGVTVDADQFDVTCKPTGNTYSCSVSSTQDSCKGTITIPQPSDGGNVRNLRGGNPPNVSTKGFSCK